MNIYRAYARVYPDGRTTRTRVIPDRAASVTEPAVKRLVNHSHLVPPDDRYLSGYYKIGFVGPDPAAVEAAVDAAIREREAELEQPASTAPPAAPGTSNDRRTL